MPSEESSPLPLNSLIWSHRPGSHSRVSFFQPVKEDNLFSGRAVGDMVPALLLTLSWLYDFGSVPLCNYPPKVPIANRRQDQDSNIGLQSCPWLTHSAFPPWRPLTSILAPHPAFRPRSLQSWPAQLLSSLCPLSSPHQMWPQTQAAPDHS